LSADTNAQGRLRQVLDDTTTLNRCGMGDLTVLSPQRDPYRLDTPAGHRDGGDIVKSCVREAGASSLK
jgi:hypothetical protein